MNVIEKLNSIKSGEITAKENVEGFIKVIDENNEKINAFIGLNYENALKQAEAIDEKIANGEEVGALAGLVFGGQWFVDGASGIASSVGVSESTIGLTIVAGGTSLPELATSVTAALKKNSGMAVGNVIGSNLFNIFFVLGCSATISPLPMGGINNVDLAVLVGSAILFWIVGWFFKKRTITRVEGALLVICYVAYTAYLISQQ